MNALPKLMFVNVPAISLNTVKSHFKNKPGFFYVAMPSGIIILSAYAKMVGAVQDVEILDYTCEMLKTRRHNSIEEFIDGLALESEMTPDVIAFSVNFTTSHDFLILAADRLKMIWPDAKIIVGGHHATSCTRNILEHDSIDYAVRGEGEIGFADWLASLADNKIPADIFGIYDKQKILIKAPLQACKIVQDLDELPSPDWELIDMHAYMTSGATRTRRIGSIDELTNVAQRVATFSFTRGCPFQCTFCASHQVHGRTMRFKSADKVIDELKVLRGKYGANVFFPDDDLFTASRPKTKELLRLFRDTLTDCELQTPGGLSVNTLDNEVLDLFIETGTTVLTLAVESGSEYVQRNIIKKNCNLEKAKEQVRYLRERGVIVRTFFIVGFPQESLEQMQETIDFAIELSADWAGLAIAIPLPGTEIYDELIDLGAVDPALEGWAENYEASRTFDTPLVSAEEVKSMAYHGNLHINFFQNPNKREGNYEKAIGMYSDITRMHSFHIVGWYCIMECLIAMERQAEASEIEEKIYSLVQSDEMSADMYKRSYDKMPLLDHDRIGLTIDLLSGPNPDRVWLAPEAEQSQQAV